MQMVSGAPSAMSSSMRFAAALPFEVNERFPRELNASRQLKRRQPLEVRPGSPQLGLRVSVNHFRVPAQAISWIGPRSGHPKH